jgi:exosortase A-associated hydrolase 2
MQPFFLATATGRRFCLYLPPADARAPRGAVVYVHPFAEEMNKSRRMAALGARRFAAAGYGVLLIDLLGCGDSDGDFADATWEAWLDDIGCGVAWLRQAGFAVVNLWGLRLGATLALTYRVRSGLAGGWTLLWQPVTSGELFLKQFLRLEVAGRMLAADGVGADTRTLRDALLGGQSLEIAGYTLSSALARGVDAARISAVEARDGAIAWIDVTADAASGPSPASRRAVDALRAAGNAVTLEPAHCEPFWTTQEIVDCPALIELSLRATDAFA